ncbi:TraR/DksA C4-type zinc finger protein [Ignatzschineria cameli]|nr:TraR/DksA C4-type zinc finger protein [Ignatzschineria cameli]
MSDIIDKANELASWQTELALKNMKQKKPGLDPLIVSENGVDIQLCADCEEEIPPQRLKALPDAVLCIDCQERWERHL